VPSSSGGMCRVSLRMGGSAPHYPITRGGAIWSTQPGGFCSAHRNGNTWCATTHNLAQGEQAVRVGISRQVFIRASPCTVNRTARTKQGGAVGLLGAGVWRGR
jgi:hypothetical protein